MTGESMASPAPYDRLSAQPGYQTSKRRILLASLGGIALLCIIAVVLGVTLSVNHPEWKDCDKDYWKERCRLRRGYPTYNNFLAHAGLLLPSIIHQTVTAEQLGEGRILFIGDIHGCRDEFLHLLAKVDFEKGKDNLILVGDMVDKGPYSVQVLQEAQRLGALSVRGNHEDTGLAAYEGYHRGEEVIEKHEWTKQLPQEDARWIASLPWSISLPSLNIVVVHAGLVPKVPLERQLLVDLNHMREVGPGDDTEYRGIEGKPEPGEGPPWATVWDGPQHVVFGHDHKKGLQDESFATGIDTGAANGIYLTGLLLPSLQDIEDRGVPVNSSLPDFIKAVGGRFVRVKSKRNYVGETAQ